jgi:hypothetical protein
LEVAYSRTQEAARRLVWVSLVHLPLMFLVMALDKIPASSYGVPQMVRRLIRMQV